LSTVILLIVSIAGGYFVWERTIAATVFERGILKYQATSDIVAARESTTKAISMVQSDVYWRGLTEISLVDLGKALGSITNENQITDSVKAQIQGLISNSVESAKKATEIDSNNFQNWFALARVYEALASNGIEGAQDNARANYTEAAKHSPKNPSVPLALARLDAMGGKSDEAKINIAKALELKKNYTDAYYTLAQLEVALNNIPGAIKSVEDATIVDPTNPGLYFQLGLLKYNQKDYKGAIGSLEKSVSLMPDYANAKYFLGLSYYEEGLNKEAIKQFEEINKNNPDNAEVVSILSKMKAGQPVSQKTDSKDSNPPVKEN